MNISPFWIQLEINEKILIFNRSSLEGLIYHKVFVLCYYSLVFTQYKFYKNELVGYFKKINGLKNKLRFKKQ